MKTINIWRACLTLAAVFSLMVLGILLSQVFVEGPAHAWAMPETDVAKEVAAGGALAVMLDTIVIGLPGYPDDTLFLILHLPDPLADPADTVHMIEYGYRRAGIGWTVTMSQGYWENAGYAPDYEGPTVIYTVDPVYQMDANQDGMVNIGDLVRLHRYIFLRER